MRQLIAIASFVLFSTGMAQAEIPSDAPTDERVSQLTQALIAGDVGAAHDMASSFLTRKLSLYAFQGMMETGGVFGEAGAFELGTSLREGEEISLSGYFIPATGADRRPVRFTWLSEDGEWFLHRFGF